MKTLASTCFFVQDPHKLLYMLLERKEKCFDQTLYRKMKHTLHARYTQIFKDFLRFM